MAHADYWRVLPENIRRAIHEGLLASNVVSFHTRRWSQSFLRCCADILDIEPDAAASEVRIGGHVAHVRARPISVDPDEFDEVAESDTVRGQESLIENGRPEFLVLRVDRTDPSKNVVRGFRAYELYLDAHPEMHGRVQMLALLDPSRQDIPEYAEYLGAIRAPRGWSTTAPREGWNPARCPDPGQLSAGGGGLQAFDVLLVNAILDGMNLVARRPRS